MSSPLVSVCLPTLNARRFLESRMDTIFAQSLRNWELVVCDSFSDDGTWEYLQKFGSDPRVKLHQVPRKGLYAGWNECLGRITGEYVYIATADDTCEAALLEKMVGVLERGGNHRWTQMDADRMADLAVCQFDFIDEKGARMVPPPKDVPGTFFEEWNKISHRRSGDLELLVHLCLGVSWTTITSVVFRSSLLKKVGLFRTDCGAFADRYWAVRSALCSDTLVLPERLATWRIHGGQGSRTGGISLAKRIYGLMRQTVVEIGEMDPRIRMRDSKWKEKLLWNAMHTYFRGFNLDRIVLKETPGLFWKGLLQSLIYDPRYLGRRLAHGLDWDESIYKDERIYLKELIRDWQIPEPARITISGITS